MRSYRLFTVAVLILAVAFIILIASCSNNNITASTPTAVTPQPKVESVVASTSGTQSAYFTTLDIKVKNNGAEGTVLVQASVTQNGRTSQDEMPVFLQQGEEHELKLTFPLVWEGGNYTFNVQAILPASPTAINSSPTTPGVSSSSPSTPSQNTLFSSQAISQGPSLQTMIYTFTPAYSGYLSITGTSSSSTGYILVANTTSGVSNTYTFGTGTAMNASLTAGNSYAIYFGNHDASGTITATLTGTYHP